MGRILKNMAIVVPAILAMALLCVANTHPLLASRANVQNFKQPLLQKVTPVSGSSSVELYPVLLVEFSDVKFSVKEPARAFSEFFNGKGYNANGASGSVAEYLDVNFRGKRKFAFEVSDVISLENPVQVYGAPSGTFNDTDVMQLVKDACSAAKASGTDFSRYDNDGDGKVDNVAIVFAGYSESDGGDPNFIWPHQQYMPQRATSGEGVDFASYTCTSELSGIQGATISPPGTFCHEFAHYLGLQDMYDVNGEEEGISPALYGSLSIMDKGNLLNNGNTPPYFNAVEREMLGIAEIVDLVPDKIYNLKPVQESDVLYRMKSSNEGEYFLLENRVAKGWDAHIGGSGLVVYHIDKSGGVYAGIPSVERWGYNNINTFAGHECVRVIAALGKGGDVTEVFYPGKGNVRSLVSWEGKMPLRDWGGHSVGIGIENISFVGDMVTFRTVEDYSLDPDLPAVADCRVTAFQREMKVEWNPGSQDIETGRWLVKWKFNEGEQNFITREADTSCFWISGIKPGGEYEIQVSVLNGKSYGTPAAVEATTVPYTSMYPYIYVRNGGYGKGDEMDLRVINLVAKHVSVAWQVDGVPVEGDSICLNKEGKVSIMAIIKYQDGSEEKIYKKVEVR